MDYSTIDAWITGPVDIEEADVEDVPVPGQKVRVRGLAAGFSNQASSEALELKTIGTEQRATVNTARLEVIQFAHGCVNPTFTQEQATVISERFGPAFKKVIAKIDQLSGVDKEALEKAEARFPASPNGESPPVDSRPDAGPRVGAPAGDDEG